MVPKLEVTHAGPKSTPVAFKDADDKRGGEDNTLAGCGSTYRGEGGGPPSKKVRDLHYGLRLGPKGEGQPLRTEGWGHAL